MKMLKKILTIYILLILASLPVVVLTSVWVDPSLGVILFKVMVTMACSSAYAAVGYFILEILE